MPESVPSTASHAPSCIDASVAAARASSSIPAYLGVSVEAGNVWATRDDVDCGDLETGGSLFLGAESPFGPVYLAAGLASGGEMAFYLYLGKTF